MTHPVHESTGLLFERAKDNLNRADLLQLAGLSEVASEEARRMATITESIGCLLAHDMAQGKAGSGDFRTSEEVLALLSSMARSFETIGTLAGIGSLAADRLIHPNASKAGAE